MAAKKRNRAAYHRARYLAKRDEVLARSRAWKEANRDRKRATDQEWRLANVESIRAATRRWQEANPEKYLASKHAWNRRNREYNRVAAAKYRARQRAATVGPISRRVIRALLDDPCAYCGSTENIEIDHIIPLSRGGTHTPENLAPACRSCNRSKGAKLLSEWLVAA